MNELEQEAILTTSAFKKDDLVLVEHRIYTGRGKILQHGWLENIHRKEGEPSHYLVWVIFPDDTSDNWPGVVDIIDPMYGFTEPGRSMKKVMSEEAKKHIVKFEHGEVLGDDTVLIEKDGANVEVLAKYVPLGEGAWQEGFLGKRLQEAPICPYCTATSEHVGGDVIYPRRPDLAEKKFWICKPCNAYVGCHKGTPEPLGRLADAELRQAKMDAHEAFDALWSNGEMKRGAAYRWLAEKLGIAIEKCHIGMFDIDTCRKVVEVVASRGGTASG